MRVTWVQPEDLVPHELAASREEGRAVDDIEARWRAAGGPVVPPVGGASAHPATPELRALALRLLDEFDVLPRDAEAPADAGDARPIAAGDGRFRGVGGAVGVPALAGAPTTGEPDDLATIRAAWPARSPAARVADHPDRVRGAWLGRAAGCLLGKPVEKVPRDGIREILMSTGRWPLSGYFTAVGLPAEVAERWPWNKASRGTSLAENIAGMPEDDDLNYPLLALWLLENVGPDFRSDDVAQAWLTMLPAGRVFTAERVAYQNLLSGVDPPETARRHNPFRQWIGAQIRTDLYGWTRPGDPVAAAELAYRDARISHVRNGVYGALYAAAMGAAAVVESTVDAVLDAGLAVVPPGSRFAAAVRYARALVAREPDWETVVDGLYARYGQLHWVHVLPNAALATAALAYGRGDFGRTICAAVSGGWDTDSTGATVGGVVGALLGARALPEEWVAPLDNRLATSLPGFSRVDGIGFDELAERTVAVSV